MENTQQEMHMDNHRRLGKALGGLAAVVAFIGVAQFAVDATPPSGISFVPVGRATLPQFDVRRRLPMPQDAATDDHHRRNKFFKIELEATESIDVATQIVTFQPGGYSGWHTHPGPVFFTVRTGTLTVYEGDDPSCTPLVFPAGTGALEAGTARHVHMVRNETGSVAEALVTYLAPVGTPQNQLRSDRPDPGNCPF
jgi:mannose-6-phosphate isomerase-like protein (cupin superfamily)